MGKAENNGVINTKVPFFKELIDVIDKEVFKNVDNDIQGIYKTWNDENLNSDVDSKSKPVVRDKELLRHENQKIPINDVKLLGIDLPSWYGDYNSKNKIMIIGIDPMRHDDDFKEALANPYKEVLIGTPYAFHNSEIRVGTKNQNYTQFINNLIDDNNNFVYLTDIYKLFFYTDIVKKNEFIRSYDYYGKSKKKEGIRNSILVTLLEEIRLINPTIIITFGRESFKQLTLKNVVLSKNNISSSFIGVFEDDAIFKKEFFLDEVDSYLKQGYILTGPLFTKENRYGTKQFEEPFNKRLQLPGCVPFCKKNQIYENPPKKLKLKSE
jgi:uracil-DNA glycosylase